MDGLSLMDKAVQLIESGNDINECNNWNRDTLLHDACWGSDIMTVKYLIEHGSDMNRQNLYGNTPLHYAICIDSNIGIIEYLLSSGADRTILNYNGLTAKERAFSMNKHNFVQFIEGFQDVPTKGVQAG